MQVIRTGQWKVEEMGQHSEEGEISSPYFIWVSESHRFSVSRVACLSYTTNTISWPAGVCSKIFLKVSETLKWKVLQTQKILSLPYLISIHIHWLYLCQNNTTPPRIRCRVQAFQLWHFQLFFFFFFQRVSSKVYQNTLRAASTFRTDYWFGYTFF